MPVEIEQWRAEIGNFNGCSQLSVIIKLYFNMRNLLNMLLVFICTFALSRDISSLNLIAVDHYGCPKKHAQKCFL